MNDVYCWQIMLKVKVYRFLSIVLQTSTFKQNNYAE